VGLKRILSMAALAAVVSLGVVSAGLAGNFDETTMNCPGEDPGVCPTGTTGQPYSLNVRLQGDEDTGCAVLSVSSGSLPSGLSITQQFNETKYAVISGTPTQAGTYDFFLTVTYNAQPSCNKPTSDDRFRIAINQGLDKLTIGPESTTPGTTGAPYSLQMTASVADPKTWTINSGTLPPGLAIDGSSGLISGTPVTAGSYTFEVLAKMNGDTRSDTKVLGIVIRDPLSIVGSEPFTAARRAVGEMTAPFDAVLAASGGDGTYVWSLSTGALPPGLAMADGAITGSPTASGVYPFTVTVTDAEARVANYPARIVVAEKLAVSTLLLRPGKVGKLYAAKVATSGGVKPATWRIVVGPLPRGVRFDRTTGRLSGIPKRPGRYRVAFEATDSLGVKAKKTLAILVAPAPKK
jgi:hypothetical protein